MIYPKKAQAGAKLQKMEEREEAVGNVTTAGLDMVVPGAGTLTKGVDSLFGSLTKKDNGVYKSDFAQLMDVAFNPMTKIKAVASGDWGVFTGKETHAEKAVREAKEKAAKEAQTQFQRNSSSLYPVSSRSFSSYEEGGSVTTHNVIPKGVLHSEDNKIGSKGLPVIFKGKKVAEIEKEEITFTKNVSQIIEELTKRVNAGDKKATVKLGEFVHNQIANNTIDYSKRFLR